MAKTITVREYIEQLNALVAKSKAVLDLEMVYSSDDEGNDMKNLYRLPMIEKIAESGTPQQMFKVVMN